MTSLPRLCWLTILGTFAFAAAYGQAELFYSNQNQYFLHGYADAGEGELANDWLARTADPTPIFSAIVRFSRPWQFHLLHGLLLALYAGSLVRIFQSLASSPEVRARWPWFLLFLTLIHSAALRWTSYRLIGQDYPWYLQAGVAGQYVLGAMLQPSVFGVLLIAAVMFFLRDHIVATALTIAAAATIHTTYVLPGALLTAGFLVSLAIERRWRDAVHLGSVALVGTLPIVVFAALRFAPTSPEIFGAAQALLVDVRIPHHCRVDLWLDPIAWMQIGWIALSLVIVWRTRMFAVLAVPFALSTILTLVQAETKHPTLALLFPWRVSVILMPLATAVILGRIVGSLRLPTSRGAMAFVIAAMSILAAAGFVISMQRLAFRTSDDELPLYQFVRESRQPGNCYLIPVRVPNLAASTRGSFSSDFKPLAEKKSDVKIIPLDLQRFRLLTGTPIYVDFKSIPYKDTDVIEWHERLKTAQDLFANPEVEKLRKLGITHIVVPAGRMLESPFRRVHADPAYQVYQAP